MPAIIDNQQEVIEIPEQWENKIDQVLTICLQEEGVDPKAEVSILFVNDEEIHQLNKEYRDKDTATDVLSFPIYDDLEEMENDEEILLGDIVISTETAIRQGEEYGHGLEREVMYLLVHGLLHLLGYDHMNDEDKQEMRQREEVLLAAIGAIR